MTIHIHFKLYASLADYLPQEAHGNQIDVELPDNVTPNQIIDRFKVPREQTHLILHNGVYIKPEDRDRPLFQDGDTLAVWPPVAGG